MTRPRMIVRSYLAVGGLPVGALLLGYGHAHHHVLLALAGLLHLMAGAIVLAALLILQVTGASRG